jgi:imidazole glycerol-phosphate synthase
MPKVHLLDYVAGNVRSLVNAIEKIGYEVEWIKSPEEVADAEVGNVINPLGAAQNRAQD